MGKLVWSWDVGRKGVVKGEGGSVHVNVHVPQPKKNSVKGKG